MYISNNSFFESLNNKTTDAFFHYRGEVKPSDNIVIVDIDEKSLKELGQWPWSRDKVAQILQNLTNAEVGIIGLDIVFAEPDSSSPKRVLDKLGIKGIEAPDFDDELAKTFSNTPTISGYIFNFQEETEAKAPNISTIIVEKNYKDEDYLPVAKGVITNISVLQENSYSSGFFNTIPDNDGIVRSVPLIVKYDGSIYPSLSLEMLRLVYGAKKIVINYEDIGISSISLDSLDIPTDRFGRLSLNYYGKSRLFRYMSAVDIYNNSFKKEDIEGRIVLVGTSASGLLDLRATPFESTYAGVEVHTTAMENITNQSYITHPSWVEAVDILIIFVLLLLIVFLFLFLGALKTAIMSVATIGAFIYVAYYFFVQDGIVLNVIYPVIASTILYMILTSLHYLFESKQKELIKNKFAKKVSKAVAESLIKQGNKDILEAKEKEITIFFSDIRGFTTISENFADPKKLIYFLNLYMTPMTEIITQNHGTVDKFIGDAIMAYWNAPLDIENHADMALQSAIKQIYALKKLNIFLEEKNLPQIDIGIGINTGFAVVGEMGSSGRSDYTVIGDSVNLASRTEGLCKTYKAQILITEFTKQKLKKRYNIKFLDEVKVKGKEKSVKIYKVIPDDKNLRISRE
jgi:adenylate cyclase